jgi:zinc transport system substrate-binding protein
VTEDGSLHQIDVLDGKLSKTAKVTEPYSMDGHWNDPRRARVSPWQVMTL